MKKSLKILSGIILAGFLSLVPLTLPFNAFAAIDPCENVQDEEQRAALGCNNTVTTAQVSTIVQNILQAIIGAIAVVAVIFVIIGGINYMTSEGDQSKVEKAKKTILNACIGLIICALSFAIVNFTISLLKRGGSGTEEESSEKTGLVLVLPHSQA